MKLKTASPPCIFLYPGGSVGELDKDGGIYGAGHMLCFPENITQ